MLEEPPPLPPLVPPPLVPLEAGRELPELGEGEETPGFEGEELVPLLEDSPEAFEEEPELLSFLSPELVLSLEFSLPGLEEEFFSLEAPEPCEAEALEETPSIFSREEVTDETGEVLFPYRASPTGTATAIMTTAAAQLMKILRFLASAKKSLICCIISMLMPTVLYILCHTYYLSMRIRKSI